MDFKEYFNILDDFNYNQTAFLEGNIKENESENGGIENEHMPTIGNINKLEIFPEEFEFDLGKNKIQELSVLLGNNDFESSTQNQNIKLIAKAFKRVKKFKTIKKIKKKGASNKNVDIGGALAKKK